jgi:tRNA synthetases class II (D, K and N)
MTDIIARPIFLTHFPVDIKAFYMQKDSQDPRVTESVDCLMLGWARLLAGACVYLITTSSCKLTAAFLYRQNLIVVYNRRLY